MVGGRAAASKRGTHFPRSREGVPQDEFRYVELDRRRRFRRVCGAIAHCWKYGRMPPDSRPNPENVAPGPVNGIDVPTAPTRRPVPLPARASGSPASFTPLPASSTSAPEATQWVRQAWAEVNEPPLRRVFVRALRNVGSDSSVLQGACCAGGCDAHTSRVDRQAIGDR